MAAVTLSCVVPDDAPVDGATASPDGSATADVAADRVAADQSDRDLAMASPDAGTQGAPDVADAAPSVDSAGPADTATALDVAADVAPDVAPDVTADVSANVDVAADRSATADGPGARVDAVADTAAPSDRLPDAVPADGAAPSVDATVPPPAGVPMFMAVGYGLRRILSCDDGRTWQANQVEDPTGGDDATLARGLGYGNGLFVVAVGGGGNSARILSTDDGLTWTVRVPVGMYNGFSQVSFGGGTFVAGGGNISIRSRTGIDGWGDLAEMGGPGILRHMAAGGGHFAAVGDGGRIAVSADAVTWSAPVSGTCGGGFQIVYGQSRFLIVGDDGATCLSSDGGATWTNGTVGGINLRGVVWTGTDFLVTSNARTYRSPDGITWSSAASTGGAAAALAVSDHGTLVGVAENGGFLWSTDGVRWSAAATPAGSGNLAIERTAFGYVRASTTCPQH